MIQEYEKAFLGGLLQTASLVEEYRIQPQDFSTPFHQRVMRAILDVVADGGTPDLVTVTHKLGASEAGKVSELTSQLCSDAKYYHAQILEHSRRRRLRKLGQLVAEGADGQESAATVEEIERALLEIHDNSYSGYVKLGDGLHEAIAAIEAAYKRKGSLSGLPTGVTGLNNATDGLQPEEVVIIGARPGTGKTAISLNMLSAMAKAGHAVGYFSAEMSKSLLIQRMLSSLSGIGNAQIRSGMLTQADFAKITETAAVLFEQKVFVNDTPNIKLSDMLLEARRMKRKEGIECVFVDYLSLITNANTSVPRHEQVAEISRNLKRMARELQVPVVVLSQVNRDSHGHAPTLANIRESGAVEQDADIVLFLHPEDEPENGLQRVSLIVAKNRNGAAGVRIPLMFNQKTVTFHEVTT